jgi:hypothetical protein
MEVDIALFGFVLVSYVFTYLIGGILVTFLSKEDYNASSFLRVTAGVLGIITVYSIVKTQGVTVNILNFVFIIFITINQKEIPFNFKLNKWRVFKKDFLISFVVLIVLFLVQLAQVDRFLEPNFFNADYLFYARAAAFLRDSGFESTNIEYFFIGNKGVTPYHYAELWFTAFFSDLFKIHSLKSYIFIVVPIMYSTLFLGALRIVKQLIKSNDSGTKVMIYGLAAAFLLFSVPNLDLLINIPVLKLSNWVFPTLGHHKLMFVLLFVIWIYLFLLKREYYLMIIASCLLVVSNVSVAIPIMLSVGVFLLILLYRRQLSWKDLIIFLIPIVVTTFFIGLFYYWFAEKNGVSLSFVEVIGQYDSIEKWTTIINIIGKTTLQCLYNLFPIFILLFLIRRAITPILKDIYLFTFLSYTFGLVTYALLNEMHDAPQLWSNLFIATINITILISVSFMVLAQSKLKWKLIFTGIIVILFGVQYYLFYEEHNVELKNYQSEMDVSFLNGKRIVFIKETEDYSDSYSKYEQVYLGRLNQLMISNNSLLITCISTHKIPIENKTEKKFIAVTTFNKYLEKLRENNKFSSFNQAQEQFISDFDIEYLLNYKGRVLPENLAKEFKSTSMGVIDGYSIHERIK